MMNHSGDKPSQTSLRAAILLALAAGAPLAHAGPPAPGAALGNEFQVNSHTADDQDHEAVAMDAAGDFVAVWTSYDQDSEYDDVYAQRYHADGTPDGTEFQVNTYTSDDQQEPAVAMDADGDFVVAWASDGQDGDGYGVFARRYRADGTPDGTEFQVNTYTSTTQENPAVAMDAAGDFVVAWMSFRQDGVDDGVFAQRYHADGTAAGSEFQVNTYTFDNQEAPAVAMDAAGGFIIAWESYDQDGDEDGVFAQRYQPDGAAAGSEFQVNTYTSSGQESPAVAVDATGNFVVAWESFGQDGVVTGVFAQRYRVNGAPGGAEFQVNTHTDLFEQSPTVAMDAAGGFVVAWDSGAPGIESNVFAQRYTRVGDEAGSEFQVNAHTSGDQRHPAIATDAAGDFVVSWVGYDDEDGGDSGIFAQRYVRGTSLDLRATLAVAPADTVESGDELLLSAGIGNTEPPATLTGHPAIDDALTAASGLTATLTFPDGITFGKATGTHWTCPAAPATDGTLTCTYGASLAAASETENLTVSLTAPDADGAKLAFTNAVFGGQPDTAADNNTASADVTVKTPPPDDSGSGDDGGGDAPPPAVSSGGGGGFGWLGIGLMGLAGLRRWSSRHGHRPNPTK